MPKKIDYASMFTLRADGRYMGYWHDADRRRHAIYDRDPELLYARIVAKEQPAVEAPVLFSDVAEAWEGEYRETISIRTWNNFKPHYEDIKAKYADRAIDGVTAADVNADFLASKAKGWSRTVVNSRRVIYNGIFNYAVANGLLPYNPAASIRLPKNLPHSKRKAPTEAEIKTICSNLDAPFGFFPFFLLCTGMRKSEALALLKSDIDFKKLEINVSKSLVYIDNANPSVKPPKTEAGNRTIPIIKALEAPLRSACEENDGPILFPGTKSNRNPKASGYMTERAYEGAWDRYCAAVGLIDSDGKPTITAHQLRHGTATLLFESGVDAYTAQRILGHANVRTTMEIYTELRDKQMNKSVQRFNRALSKKLSKPSDTL